MRTSLVRPLVLSVTVAALLAGPSAFAQDKSSQLHQAMSKSMQEMQSMPMTGDVDKDFAMMMKHHHQSGIEMAQIQARNGKDPEMRQQAQKMIEAQKKDIAELDRWMQGKGKSSSSSKQPGSESSSSGQSGAGSSGHSGHEAGSK